MDGWLNGRTDGWRGSEEARKVGAEGRAQQREERRAFNLMIHAPSISLGLVTVKQTTKHLFLLLFLLVPPQAQGYDNAAARLFSNPAGDYGSMVNERVGAST